MPCKNKHLGSPSGSLDSTRGRVAGGEFIEGFMTAFSALNIPLVGSEAGGVVLCCERIGNALHFALHHPHFIRIF